MVERLVDRVERESDGRPRKGKGEEARVGSRVQALLKIRVFVTKILIVRMAYPTRPLQVDVGLGVPETDGAEDLRQRQLPAVHGRGDFSGEPVRVARCKRVVSKCRENGKERTH